MSGYQGHNVWNHVIQGHGSRSHSHGVWLCWLFLILLKQLHEEMLSQIWDFNATSGEDDTTQYPVNQQIVAGEPVVSQHYRA